MSKQKEIREGIRSFTGCAAVNCEVEGHCPHEGTAIGSLYCCKCGQYLYSLANRFDFYEAPYPKFVRQSKLEIDAHPRLGVSYL